MDATQYERWQTSVDPDGGRRHDTDRSGSYLNHHEAKSSMMERLKLVWHLPRTLLAMIFIGICVGSLALGAMLTLVFYDTPPLVILSSRMLDPVVSVDGDIRFLVRATSHENRNCPGSITREYYRPVVVDGKDLREKRRTDGPAPIIHDGETEYVVVSPLAPNMMPGAWTFQGETSYYCGLWGGTKRYRTQELPFTIVDKNR